MIRKGNTSHQMKTGWRVFWIIASIAVMAVIFFFSSQNSGKSENLSDAVAGVLRMEQKEAFTRVSNQKLFLGLTLRKLAHIILFAGLGFCLANAFTGVRGRLFWAAGFGYLYAVADELHQTLSGRYGRWEDTLIDLAGIVMGIFAATVFTALWMKVREKKRVQSPELQEEDRKRVSAVIRS